MTVFTIKKSNVAGKVPAVSDLEIAELAINLQDKKLYTKDATGAIVSIGGSVSSGPDTDKPPSPSPGDLFYDDTTDELQFWNGTAWESIVSTDGSGSVTLALAQLSDVAVVGVTDGQVLGYQTDEWIPVNLPVVNNSTVTINDSSGTEVGVFTVNQAADSTIALPAPPVVNDSAVTINASDGSEVGSFTVNQDAASTIVLPAPPVVNDSSVTINDSAGAEVGSFTVNQASDSTIVLPVVPLSVSSTEPTAPVHGDIWVDTSACPPTLKIYSDPSECPEDSGWEEVKGGGGGGTAVDFPPSEIPGGSLTLSATTFSCDNGLLEFSNNDGATWSATLTSDIADVVAVRWIETAFDDAAAGSTVESVLTYNILDGETYETTYKYDVDKLPNEFTFADTLEATPNAMVPSTTVVVLSGTNAPVRAWATTDTLALPQIRVNGGAWVDVDGAEDDSVVVPVGATIEIRHLCSTNPVAPNITTLYLGWDAGNSTSATYSTTTANVIFDTPTISTPGFPEINKAAAQFNGTTPSGVNINHKSTDWQLGDDETFANVIAESLADETNLTSWTTGAVPDGTTYYARMRYNDLTGIATPFSTIGPLSTNDFFFWRIQVRASGGPGGGARKSNSNKNNPSGGGGGTMVLETVDASPVAPGTLERIDGSGSGEGYGKPGSAGAFGANGGNGAIGGGDDPNKNQSGNGGGGGGVKLNGTLLFGVGGGGGGPCADRGSGSSGAGIGPEGTGNNAGNGTSDGGASSNNGGTSRSSPSSGGNGSAGSDEKCAGAGGGGFGGGGAGALSGDNGKSQGGGGGGSWNQAVTTVVNGWKVTGLADVGASGKVVRWQAPVDNPTAWTNQTVNDGSGSINIGTMTTTYQSQIKYLRSKTREEILDHAKMFGVETLPTNIIYAEKEVLIAEIDKRNRANYLARMAAFGIDVEED